MKAQDEVTKGKTQLPWDSQKESSEGESYDVNQAWQHHEIFQNQTNRATDSDIHINVKIINSDK